MTTVRMKHFRQARLCASGVREWFASVGFDWNDFLDNGIAAERIEAAGNSLANRAVDEARRDVAE